MDGNLQKIPCYDSTYCGYVYNCGGTTYPFSCDPTKKPVNKPIDNIPTDKCPSGLEEGYCYGNDPSYCSGIYQTCDVNLGYNCQIATIPAKNLNGDYLGCNVEKDSPCMEFEDYEPCQDDCWNLGGSSEVYNVCNTAFKDKDSCNSMKYFCKWDSSNNSCSSVSKTTDPWTLFKENGPKDISGKPSTISSEYVGPNKNWILNCAQSSWSSTFSDSFVNGVRTCCLDKNDGSKQQCVTTPRCQFVDTTCDCGFKDIDYSNNPNYNEKVNTNDPKYPWFICEETKTLITTDSGAKLRKGYCTWCKGTMIKDFDYRNWLHEKISENSDIRSNIAWGTSNNCKNRCSNYNKCEVKDSEKLWDECIAENSKGVYGNDFCYSNLNDCIAEAGNDNKKILECNIKEKLVNFCENKLQPTISTKNKLAIVQVNSNGTMINALPNSEGSAWSHNCIKSSGGITSTENYACGWCPNLINEEMPKIEDNNDKSSNKWYSVFNTSENNAIGIIIGIILVCIAIIIAIIIVIKRKSK